MIFEMSTPKLALLLRELMKSTAEDLVNRRPVWEALSDLFLDTEVSLDRQWRIDVLAASPYSIEELEYILIDEVYPICKYNLLSVAGEWAGFDLAWLEDQIRRRLNSSLRCFHAMNLGRIIVPLSDCMTTALFYATRYDSI
jgi:hypothetical protein